MSLIGTFAASFSSRAQRCASDLREGVSISQLIRVTEFNVAACPSSNPFTREVGSVILSDILSTMDDSWQGHVFVWAIIKRHI